VLLRGITWTGGAGLALKQVPDDTDARLHMALLQARLDAVDEVVLVHDRERGGELQGDPQAPS
jgi:hypothetical protein